MNVNKLIPTTRSAAALVVVAAFAANVASASAAPLRSAVSSLPRLPAQARVLGALAPTHRLRLTVSLKPRSATALRRYATAVSTPGDADYGRFLSVSQFATRFGAPRPRITAVRRTLRSDGLSIGRLDRNHLTLDVSAPAKTVEHAFDVSLFAVRLGGRRAFANRSEATLPASIARDVQAVNGFDDVTLEHTIAPLVGAHARLRRQARVAAQAPTGGPQPCAAATAQTGEGPLTADEIATAYQYPSFYGAGDFGQGQTIGLIEIGPFIQSDIATFDTCYDLSSKVDTIDVDGGPAAEADDLEPALDIEIAQSMAPQATIDVYQGPPDLSSVVDTWSAAISADSAKQLSASIGLCEPDAKASDASAISAENTLFQEAATQGQSVFASAGDQGSAACDTSQTPTETELAVNDPASQPFVTGVGGTSLFSGTPNAPAAYAPPAAPVQGVWNDGNDPEAGPSGTGGGISELSTMPSYQSSAPASLGVSNANSSATPCDGGSSLCREVPDVSANADPDTGYVVFATAPDSSAPGGVDPAQWLPIGGTSASSPLWASWIAETNDLAACGGKTIGFANPLLYSIAGTSFASNFTDIVDASPISRAADNDAAGAHGGLYPDTAGYDMATGLGSMTSQLASSLCAARDPSSSSPPPSSPPSPSPSPPSSSPPPSSPPSSSPPSSAPPASPPRSSPPSSSPPRSSQPHATSPSPTPVGSVKASAVKLTGLAKRKPKLTLTLAAVNGSPAIRAVSIKLPTGLSFATAAKRVRRGVTARPAARAGFSAKARRRSLAMTLKRPVSHVRIKIAAPELADTRSEAAKARAHKLRSLTIKLDVTNAKHGRTALSVKLKQLS